jgi:hypothetical protein
VSLEFLAKQQLATSAVEALVAKLGVAESKSIIVYIIDELEDELCNDTLTNGEVLDILSNSCNNTDSLVS